MLPSFPPIFLFYISFRSLIERLTWYLNTTIPYGLTWAFLRVPNLS